MLVFDAVQQFVVGEQEELPQELGCGREEVFRRASVCIRSAGDRSDAGEVLAGGDSSDDLRILRQSES